MMRTTLLGHPVDILTLEETVARALEAIAAGRRCQHAALDVASLVEARSEASCARHLAQSDLVGIAGMGVVFALRLAGHRVPARVAPVDLFERLVAECAARGLRPFLLGAAPDALAAVEADLLRRHPRLRIAGRHHGCFRLDQERTVRDHILASEADCLFIALPARRRERFLRSWRDSLGVPFLMGVGDGFALCAGEVTRAPGRVQRLGLEWLYRLAQAPRRMAWRSLRDTITFAALVLREAILGRRARTGRRAVPSPAEAPDRRASEAVGASFP